MDRKKYGLQLRVPPSQQKKQPTRPPRPTPLAFNDDDDDDVEKEISRQANKTKSMKDVSLYSEMDCIVPFFSDNACHFE